MQIEIILFVLFGIWLSILTLVFYSLFRVFGKLTKGVGEKDLKKALEAIFEIQDKNREELAKVEDKIKSLEKDGQLHIQKIGLIRFNPFSDLGGDHSFSLAILDGGDTGVVITGLHTRERTRVYMKAIKNGKSEATLSNEEKKALEKAQKT